MATEYTPNYNLDLYASTDKPNLRDQYNAAMGKIDTQMKANADGVTNANANVGTLQTQMTEAQKDISALESTVEAHGSQITGVQKTADDALSLAQTNESDIAQTQADVTSLTARTGTVENTANQNKSDISSLDTRVGVVEGDVTEAQSDIAELRTSVNGKAPTNHASTANIYGQGSPTNFGHLKVVDSGTATASTGTAASPKLVNDLISSLLPKVVLNQATSVTGLSVAISVSGGTVVCSLVKTASSYSVPSGDTTLATIPAAYRPNGSFSLSCIISAKASNQQVAMYVSPNGQVSINNNTVSSVSETNTGQVIWNIVNVG